MVHHTHPNRHDPKRILFAFTSAGETPGGGWFLPEAAHPYWVLKDTFDIDFASPKGANPPIARASLEQFRDDEESQKFLNDPTVKQKLANAKPLAAIKSADYDAIYYPGGHGPVFDLASDQTNIKLAQEFYHDNKIIAAVCHGPVFDLASDQTNIKLAQEFYHDNKIIAAVCHGPAALVEVKDKHGGHIFRDRDVCGFSNDEEEMTGLSKEMPFLLENKIKQLGGHYVRSNKPWEECVRVDGHLITGQNPASSKGVGVAMLELLK